LTSHGLRLPSWIARDAEALASRDVTLADDLADWTDWDYAGYSLGLQLGILSGDFAVANKAVFWTDNPLGNGLHDALLALVTAGVLERREEPDEQFRWRGTRRPAQA
jgi:hypothetical protein